MRRVVVVSGAGRSGTSTLAGSLSKLGLHLPQPEVPADDTNPRGFYESQWVVDLHKELLERTPVVRTLDSRPEAVELAATLAAMPDARPRLDAWLTEQADHPQVLVKDPRAFWFHDLWRGATHAQGAELAFLTMLRHPAEVAASRDTHYASQATGKDESFRRRRATANVAAWCNVAFVTEAVTRADRRAFVRYTDLLEDWRAALGPALAHTGVVVDLDRGAAVDDFIDAGLRRSEPSWEAHDVPDLLRDLAEDTWAEMNRLVDDPADAAAVAALTTLRADYLRLHDHAVAIALDHTNTREVRVRRNAKANTARDYQERIDELEAQLAEARESTGGRGFFSRR